jgi:hypothetical protein
MRKILATSLLAVILTTGVALEVAYAGSEPIVLYGRYLTRCERPDGSRHFARNIPYVWRSDGKIVMTTSTGKHVVLRRTGTRTFFARWWSQGWKLTWDVKVTRWKPSERWVAQRATKYRATYAGKHYTGVTDLYRCVGLLNQ